MAVSKQTSKRASSTTQKRVTGRLTPSTSKAGYTSDGRRYGCGGSIKKKKKC